MERFASELHIGANSLCRRLKRNPEPIERHDRIVKLPGHCVGSRCYDQHTQDANS